MYASWSLAEMALFTKSYRYDFATCNHTVTLKPAFGSCSCPCLYTPHSRLPHGLRGSAWLHCLTMRLCHRRSVQDRISVTPCPVSHVFLGPSTTDHHVLHLSLCLHCMRICLKYGAQANGHCVVLRRAQALDSGSLNTNPVPVKSGQVINPLYTRIPARATYRQTHWSMAIHGIQLDPGIICLKLEM